MMIKTPKSRTLSKRRKLNKSGEQRDILFTVFANFPFGDLGPSSASLVSVQK